MTLAIPASPPAPASTTLPAWTIDEAHTDILFSAKHMMVTTVRGKFHDVDGTLFLDEADPTRSSADIRIAAASLSTGSDPRDGHLRSADFFDAEKYPYITFRSTSVEHVKGDDYRGDRRPHDPRDDAPGHVRRDVPRLLHRACRAAVGPGSPRGPRSTARTGTSAGTSLSRPAAGSSADGDERSSVEASPSTQAPRASTKASARSAHGGRTRRTAATHARSVRRRRLRLGSADPAQPRTR